MDKRLFNAAECELLRMLRPEAKVNVTVGVIPAGEDPSVAKMPEGTRTGLDAIVLIEGHVALIGCDKILPSDQDLGQVYARMTVKKALEFEQEAINSLPVWYMTAAVPSLPE